MIVGYLSNVPMDSAAVSVIIPCYRCANTLERAVYSVIAQTHVPAEIIFIEDKSNDEGATLNTINLLSEKIRDRIKTVVVQMPFNAGPASARNAGWDKASQPFIAFLDADDSWHPRKIELQLNWMLANPHATLTGHSSRVHDNRTGVAEIDSFLQRPYDMLWSNPFFTRGIMLKTGIGFRFPEGMYFGEDGYLWASILCAGNTACYNSDCALAFSYKMNFDNVGLSGNLWGMQKGEIKIINLVCRVMKFNIITRILAWSWSGLRFVRRILLTYFRF
jgi:glycosyltransferase involved in cell wall biosynthesis